MPNLDQDGEVRYSGWPRGMDNRRSDVDLADDTLRDAVNVDILTSGRVRRRKGITQVIADTGAHSVYSEGKRLVWATPSTLKVRGIGTILTDTRLAAPISYTECNGEIYFSNEQVNGKINTAGQYEPWGIVPPATAPACSASAGSYLFQVTCAFVTGSGEESGSGLAIQVLTSDPAVITVSNIPQSNDPRVTATRLYVTGVDGEVFFRNQDVPAGWTVATLTGPFDNGMALKNQFNSNPPPGQIVERYKGWIFIAVGNLLIHTDALRYGIYDNTASFFMFPERITMVKAVPDGIYVSADKTYWMPGAGTADVQQIQVLPYRAVEGAACNLPNSPDVMWMSERGIVRASAGGQVTNLTEATVAVDGYSRGCLSYVKNAGHQAVVAVMQNPVANPLVSPEFNAGNLVRLAELV